MELKTVCRIPGMREMLKKFQGKHPGPQVHRVPFYKKSKRQEEVKGSYSGPELGKEKLPISLHVACKSLTMCGKDKLRLECARAQTQQLATPFPLGSPGCLFLPEACRICRENLDAWASLSMQPLSGNNQSPKSQRQDLFESMLS